MKTLLYHQQHHCEYFRKIRIDMREKDQRPGYTIFRVNHATFRMKYLYSWNTLMRTFMTNQSNKNSIFEMSWIQKCRKSSRFSSSLEKRRHMRDWLIDWLIIVRFDTSLHTFSSFFVTYKYTCGKYKTSVQCKVYNS